MKNKIKYCGSCGRICKEITKTINNGFDEDTGKPEIITYTKYKCPANFFQRGLIGIVHTGFEDQGSME